jgi:hypothetical protein
MTTTITATVQMEAGDQAGLMVGDFAVRGEAGRWADAGGARRWPAILKVGTKVYLHNKVANAISDCIAYDTTDHIKYGAGRSACVYVRLTEERALNLADPDKHYTRMSPTQDQLDRNAAIAAGMYSLLSHF